MRHDVLAAVERGLAVPVARGVRRPHAPRPPTLRAAAAGLTHLLPSIVLNSFRVLQHFPSPQLEEVIGVRVELPRVPAVVSELVEALEGRRPVALGVRRQHRGRHRVAREQLLLERTRRTEGLTHLDVLDGHFFNTGIELRHLYSEPVYPRLEHISSVRQVRGLPGQFTKHVLSMLGEGRELSDSVRKGAIGDGLQFRRHREPLRYRAPRHVHRLHAALRQRHGCVHLPATSSASPLHPRKSTIYLYFGVNFEHYNCHVFPGHIKRVHYS